MSLVPVAPFFRFAQNDNDAFVNMSIEYDAVVVGSGPNGLAAAITLARAGCSVVVYEANATIGGGARSAELTLPGFLHDVCSAVHPLAAGSPFFKTLPLERFGLEWIEPEIPLAHPLDNGSAACLCKDIDVTAEQLHEDSGAYRRLMKPLARNWENLSIEFLQPMLHWPQHPITLAHFGILALCPATLLAKFMFKGEPARALFAGSPRIRFFHWRRRSRRHLHWCSGLRDTRWVGRFHAAAHSKFRTRLPLICVSLAGGSK